MEKKYRWGYPSVPAWFPELDNSPNIWEVDGVEYNSHSYVVLTDSFLVINPGMAKKGESNSAWVSDIAGMSLGAAAPAKVAARGLDILATYHPLIVSSQLNKDINADDEYFSLADVMLENEWSSEQVIIAPASSVSIKSTKQKWSLPSIDSTTYSIEISGEMLYLGRSLRHDSKRNCRRIQRSWIRF